MAAMCASLLRVSHTELLSEDCLAPDRVPNLNKDSTQSEPDYSRHIRGNVLEGSRDDYVTCLP